MTAAEATERVRKFAIERYPDYPSDALVAHRFSVGWRVLAPLDREGQTIFLIGDRGDIMVSSASLAPSDVEQEFLSRFGAD